jgi:ribosome biogenesis GTPase
MTLHDIGYRDELDCFMPEATQAGWALARVFAAYKERYEIRGADGTFDATIAGALRYTARSGEDFPVVGDWVLMAAEGDGDAVIHRVLPRKSAIRRQGGGSHDEVRIIAANVDCALVMQAVDRDFNLNRLDRYLAICHESNVQPFIVITKTDLVDGAKEAGLSELVGRREKDIPLFMISNETRAGYDRLESILVPGKTYCLLGSSGIGKSTLLNNLCGRDVMKTGTISAATERGRHTTSSREMFLLANGAIVVDTPGLREVGMPAAGKGIGLTFASISELAGGCRFGDCTHTKEAGCAVLEALASGELDEETYGNYLKLRKESDFHAATQAERHRKDRDFGKLQKDFLKGRERGDF